MNDSKFDDLLKAARDEVPLPPSFKQGVWSRIESAETAPVPFFTAAWHPWATALGMVATVTVGLWFGAVEVPKVNNARTAYAESISPFSQIHHR